MLAGELALRAIFQGVIITDPEQNIVSANDAFCTITGYSHAEILGQNCRFLQGADSDPATVAAIASALQIGSEFCGEILNYRKNGTRFWNELTIAPVRDTSGKLTHFVGITRDITERKQLEGRKENERRILKAVARGKPTFEVLEDLVLSDEAMLPGMQGSVLLMDADGRRLRHGIAPHLPRAFCEALDGTEIGPDTGSCGTAAFTGTNVIVADIATDPLWKNYRDLALAHGLRACWSVPILGSSGRVLGTFAYYFATARNASTAEIAAIEGAAQLASLVIERQQAQEELQNSEAELEQAFGASPIGMSLVALDGRFLRVNHAFCKMLGWSEKELLAGSFQAITYVQDISPDVQRVQEIIAGKRENYQIEKRYIHKDGHLVWAQLNVSVVRDKSGAAQHFVSQIQDITEAKIAAEALRLSEQNLSITLHCIGDGVIATDAAGLITRMNAVAERLTGWPLAQALGRELRVVFRIYDAKAHTPAINPLDLVMRSGQPLGLHKHMTLRTRDDAQLQISHSFAPIKNPAGEIVGVVLVFSDVSEAYRVQATLETTAELLERTGEMAKIGGWALDLRNMNLIWTVETCRIHEHDPAVPMTLEQAIQFYAPQARASIRSAVQAGIDHGTSWDLELPLQTEKGRDIWVRAQGVAVMEEGRAVKLLGAFQDITQHRHDVEEIRRLAFYDLLTGLPNRRLLMDRLRQAMLTSARTGQHGALMFLDLDHFKLLNDTQGHGVGDVLLEQVAKRLQSCVRDGDSVARLGGDEFVVLLEALSTHANEAATQAETTAKKILDVFGHAYDLQGHSYDSTPSIGIVVFMGDEEGIEELLKRADVAMYQAKSAGRNTARFFDPAMQAAVAMHDALEKDLRRALAAHEFVLHYQIQIDRTGLAIGAEALVRWQHPTRGLIAPGHFIPLAETTGLVLPLGQWVLETACAQLALWAHDPKRAHWSIAVNVSASQFAQSDFVASIAHALQSTGATATRLKLELTESTLLDDVADVIVKMNAIKAFDVGFSLDDFGTGYSSLSYLKRLPLEQLKIDQSFVRDLLTDPNDTMIARTIVALGHSLGLRVIAEGVETVGQYELLAGMGCDAFQGHYFGYPTAAEGLGA